MTRKQESQERAARGAVDFASRVFPTELEAIAKRRAVAATLTSATSARPLDAASRSTPTIRHALVGLGLSGGGIRSAAFNLGVLQALHRGGILPHVDYLSTVSGGGWIGSALQALLAKAPKAGGGATPFPFDDAPSDPFGLRRTVAQSAALNDLRDRASLLVPLGLGGGMQALQLVVRGQILTWSLLLPLLMVLCFLSAAVAAPYLPWMFTLHGVSTEAELTNPPWPWFTELSRYPLGFALGWQVVALVVASFFKLSAERRRALDDSASRLLFYAVVLAGLEMQLYVNLRWYNVVMSPAEGLEIDWAGNLRFATAAALALYVLARVTSATRRLARPVMVTVAFVVGVMVPYVSYMSMMGWMYVAYKEDSEDPARTLWNNIGWIVASLLAFGFATVINANGASLHRFYRSCLVRVFLPREAQATDALKLSEINREDSWAPYALINATLNLEGQGDPSLRGRNGDFFVFSRHFVGSHRVGYCATEKMQQVARDLDVGTAMAVSGAAVAPNMGAYTSRAIVTLLTFLNIRLGYWLPNPAFLYEVSEPVSRFARLVRYPVGLRYYVRELLSLVNDRGKLVYLTDGGHLENSGVFELLRRRCRLILASDAEEDPALAFGGLATLVRLARVELHIEIEIDVRPLGLGVNGLSSQHMVVGRIHYPAVEGAEVERGVLLYLKSSVTGDEEVLIREYRARNPAFPHQSTANQVFDEDQFEAYRALGVHAATALGALKHGASDDDAADLEAWINDLTQASSNGADAVSVGGKGQG